MNARLASSAQGFTILSQRYTQYILRLSCCGALSGLHYGLPDTHP